MSLPVVLLPPARADVRDGREFFESRRAGLGDEFVDEVFGILDRIRDTPVLYGEVRNGVRAAGVRRFGFVI